jgi:hypothetical protein
VIDAPWMIVLGEDFRYRKAEGKRPLWAKPMGWYTARVYRLARTDAQVSRRFLQVMNLMAKPVVLFEPYVLRRVLLLGPESRSVASPAPTAEATQPTG